MENKSPDQMVIEADKTLRLSSGPFSVWVYRLAQIESTERRAFCWSFIYFFSLLCGYYIIRPIRDALGIVGGVENLQWLFTSVFVAMLVAVPLFGWVTSRFPRRQFLPFIYYFFIANLILFHTLLKMDVNPVVVARAFFIWVSVYNLFVVSVFWSFMTDLFSSEQAKRLFPVIATGGSIGAIVGPILAGGLVNQVGTTNLLLVSAAFLLVAAVCIHHLGKDQQKKQTCRVSDSQDSPKDSDAVMGGRIFDGFKLILASPYLMAICALILIAGFKSVGPLLTKHSAEFSSFLFISLATPITGNPFFVVVLYPILHSLREKRRNLNIF